MQNLFPDFQNSPFYRKAYGVFFEGKKFADDVTEEEKIEAFENSFPAKTAFVDYIQQTGFVYKPESYSLQIRQAIDEYVSFAEKTAHGGLDAEEIQEADRKRTAAHHRLAKVLTGVNAVPNLRLGRTFGRILLIQFGLESFEGVRSFDEEPRRRS